MYIHTRDSWIRFLPLTTQNPKWSENNGLWLTVGDNEDMAFSAVIPLSHLCGLSTVARGSRVYGFPQVFRGPGTNFCM